MIPGIFNTEQDDWGWLYYSDDYTIHLYFEFQMATNYKAEENKLSRNMLLQPQRQVPWKFKLIIYSKNRKLGNMIECFVLSNQMFVALSIYTEKRIKVSFWIEINMINCIHNPRFWTERKRCLPKQKKKIRARPHSSLKFQVKQRSNSLREINLWFPLNWNTNDSKAIGTIHSATVDLL